MNFIKKKLKGHKKDDEEEEYEKAVYEQSLHPQNPDQKMKNTEEWQFFQQLSMKVQDTVQKTQTTLNKLKDTRPEDEDGDFYEDSELQPAEVPPYGTTKVLRAPPRPPPPAGEKSSMPHDLDFGSDFSQSSIPKGPPRPPPPKSSEASFGMDSSALPGTSNKSFSSPARPPPPNLHHQVMPDPVADPVIPSSEKVGASFSLLDEFGFQKEPVTTTSNANMQDLLFLDDKEEVDPFDTSFVDVSNIAAVPLTSEKREADKPTEKSSNPFCSSSTNDWLSSSSHSDKNSKTTTNPFFTGAVEESKPDSSLEDQSLSSHNPFSFTQPTQVNNAQDSFFGITIEPTSKDNLNKSLFENNEELIPKSSVEYEFSNEYINTAFSCNEPNINEEMQLDKVEKDIVSSSILSDDNTNAIIWDSDIKKEDSDFISDPIMAPEPVLSPEKIQEAPNMAWQGDSSSILQPEIMPSKEFEPSSEDIKRDSNEAMDVLRKSSIATNDSFSNTEQSATPSEIKSIDQVDVSNDITTNYSTTKEAGVELKMDTFSSTSIKDNSSDLLSDTADGFDSRFNETSTDIQDKPQASFTDFSKPFEGEKGKDAFLFKVKSGEDKADLEFDAFAAKFESAKDTQESDAFDPFMSKRAPTLKKIQENFKGFDSMDEFDPFRVSHKEEPPQSMMKKEPSRDSFEDYDNEVDFSVVIKPKLKDSNDVNLSAMEPPKLLPPPKTPTKAFESPASRFNPFDKDFLDNTKMAKATEQVIETVEPEDEPVPALGEAGVRKADSVETPLSPLFDEDTSQPLEIFPVPYEKEGWEMVLRQPNKKKLTGNRFWKKIIVKLSENSVLQLFNKADDKLPFQELPLQACYSLSEIGAQQYDQYGKIFTVKLQYKFYRERVGVRPGQISKVTQGQVTSMGDVAKLGLPLQHSAQTSQLLKLGSQSYLDIKFFIQEVEDALFRMTIHRDRVLTYKTEEVQVIAQDEFYVEQSKIGHIDKQLARVRIFFLAFITGMPSVEVGLNDIIRQGKEVVGRYDIIPVVTEEWIRLEDCEFHSCVIQDEFYKNRVIKFHPPDACLFELLRFRIRPPKNRELPLQVRVFMTVTNTRVEIRSDILVPGYSSRKQGQVPCENIQIRFPVPECWIYLFRTEKHFRYGSKKSTARRPGKIKGLERIIGAAQNLDPSLIEVSAGQAKYEHVFHAVVWRIPRLPKEGQGAYTQQLFLLRTELTSFDQIPESFEQFVDVEFTMPATYVSHTTVRSVSVTNPIPPEKYVRYISKHEYKVEIDFKKSTDEIDGLMNTSNVSVPISTTPAVQESTEDEDKDDSD